MPIYEYVCQDCDSQFDALRPMKEADAAIACQACESQSTRRVLSVFFAQSGGRVVAGSDTSCSSCSSASCSTCGVR